MTLWASQSRTRAGDILEPENHDALGGESGTRAGDILEPENHDALGGESRTRAGDILEPENHDALGAVAMVAKRARNAVESFRELAS